MAPKARVELYELDEHFSLIPKRKGALHLCKTEGQMVGPRRGVGFGPKSV